MDASRNPHPHPHRKRPRRQLDAIIIHFDYDCFYAAVFENETPEYRSLPLAVQQKQIVVTCNYEARRRGLYKLQLITEARKICPEIVIVLGEDLTRFRNASKQNCNFLTSFSWNNKAERLGFDEVFMDVADIVEYNAGLLTPNDLANSWFCLKKDDPTAGFAYDASMVAGHVYPEVEVETDSVDASQERLRLHLTLASHFAKHLRQQLESVRGYTCTVGISTNKLLSKLVGNVHKPDAQTTLLPPYINHDESPLRPLADNTVKSSAANEDPALDNVTAFLDGHDVGKIPGIGFKIAQKIRTHVLQRAPQFDDGLVYGGTKEKVTVRDVRTHPGMGPETLERILAGPGTPQALGGKIWGLLNGCDDTEVGLARTVPTQISIEDSYIRLDTMHQVIKELRMLAQSLMRRMHADLLEDEEEEDVEAINRATDNTVANKISKRWIAHPKTLRLSTRPRPPQNPDGSRNRSFARISRSAPLPNFAYSLKESLDVVAERLVHESLVPLFKRLHPEKQGWNLSLVNVAVTGMADAASEKGGAGRDISKMFKQQDDVLKHWRVLDESTSPDTIMEERYTIEAPPGLQAPRIPELHRGGSEDFPTPSQETSTQEDGWEVDDEDEQMSTDNTFACKLCGATMPIYAMAAHERWHN